MSARACNRCGKNIVFGKNEVDRWVALDNLTPVYRIVRGNRVVRDTKALIPHELVCGVSTLAQDFNEPQEGAA